MALLSVLGLCDSASQVPSCALTSPLGRDAVNTATITPTVHPAAGATLQQLPKQALKLGDPLDTGHGDHGADVAPRVTPPSLELKTE